MMSGATLNATHLERSAWVYIRQSSEYQVHNHVERQRLQYGLENHARDLGFHDVKVIDEDLGISGDGVYRPASRLCSRRCARAGLVWCCRLKLRGWRETKRVHSDHLHTLLKTRNFLMGLLRRRKVLHAFG